MSSSNSDESSQSNSFISDISVLRSPVSEFESTTENSLLLISRELDNYSDLSGMNRGSGSTRRGRKPSNSTAAKVRKQAFNFYCEFCKYKCQKSSTMEEHVQNEHGDILSATQPTKVKQEGDIEPDGDGDANNTADLTFASAKNVTGEDDIGGNESENLLDTTGFSNFSKDISPSQHSTQAMLGKADQTGNLTVVPPISSSGRKPVDLADTALREKRGRTGSDKGNLSQSKIQKRADAEAEELKEEKERQEMLEQLNKAKQENKTHAARKLQYPPKPVNVCPENPKSDKEEVPSQTEDEGEDTKLEGDIGENLDENDDGNQTLMDTDSDLCYVHSYGANAPQSLRHKY